LKGNKLSIVNPELFAKVLIRLEDVNLYDTHITAAQTQALLPAITQNSKLKKLDFSFNNLSTVNPELFASCSRITITQTEALFTEMPQNCHLKKLFLWGNNLSTVTPDLFAKVVTRLDDVDRRPVLDKTHQ